MAKTIDEILEDIRIVLTQEESELATFPDYGNLYTIFRSVASVVSEQDSQLDTIYESLFINTANNENLNKKAEEFGLSRQEGTKAVGSVVVESSDPTSTDRKISIKTGTILLNPYTNKQYTILDSVTVNTSRTVVSVESVEASSSSNLESGTKLISNFYRNIDFTVGDSFNRITNQYEGDITGGSERESDTDLRDRVLNAVRVRQSSTKEALEITARLVQGVTSVVVEENIPAVGYINVYIDNNDFNILNEVKLRVQEIKPLGIIIEVKAFENVPININVNISLFSKTNLNTKNNEIRNSITNFVSSLGTVFSKETLAGTLLNNNTISNVEVIAPTTSLTITNKQRFSTGSINIQYI